SDLRTRCRGRPGTAPARREPPRAPPERGFSGGTPSSRSPRRGRRSRGGDHVGHPFHARAALDHVAARLQLEQEGFATLAPVLHALQLRTARAIDRPDQRHGGTPWLIYEKQHPCLATVGNHFPAITPLRAGMPLAPDPHSPTRHTRQRKGDRSCTRETSCWKASSLES